MILFNDIDPRRYCNYLVLIIVQQYPVDFVSIRFYWKTVLTARMKL